MKKSKVIFVEVKGTKLKPTVLVEGKKIKSTTKGRDAFQNAFIEAIGKLIKIYKKSQAQKKHRLLKSKKKKP